MFIEVCSARESLGFTSVGAGLGLAGMFAIRPMRSKMNRVQPCRPNAAQTKPSSHMPSFQLEG
jgi:hypothetical protein